MKPIYIFDLDGTLALIDHRRPILDDESNPHRWDQFFKACVDDAPNEPVIRIAKELKASTDADIIVFSGRSETVLMETLKWFSKHFDLVFYDLRMRPDKDCTPDDELKRQWLHEMKPEDRRRIVAVFDDRDKVVKMWREEGLTCLQVAPGDF